MITDAIQHKPLPTVLKVALPLLLLSWLCGAAIAQRAPVFITIDAPDAGRLGTEADFVNQNGSVTGFYYDTSDVRHGFFLPSAQGSLIEFDVPSSADTRPMAINRFNQIVGVARINFRNYGFLRSGNGQLVLLDVPGSVDFAANAINDSKQIAGSYMDSNNVEHGYIRQSDGTFVFFDEPDAAGDGTVAQDINNSGVVTGYYYDARKMIHGFIRDAAGNFTSFDAPWSQGSTLGNHINDKGWIIGNYGNPDDLHSKSFERDPQGNFKKVLVPQDAPTLVYGINNLNEVVGVANARGFRRDASLKYNILNTPVPGALCWALDVNDSGTIVGLYGGDPSGKNVGFILKP